MYKRFTMQENLVIVESPAKAKTIEKFLGKDFMVKSSFGHIRDLSKKDLGINLADGFAPVYEIPKDKRKVVDELTRAAKDRTVWLASDEDREGEAIAWHLTEVLGLPVEGTKRIVFHEITKRAILEAIENPRTVDMNLVNAQQAHLHLLVAGHEFVPQRIVDLRTAGKSQHSRHAQHQNGVEPLANASIILHRTYYNYRIPPPPAPDTPIPACRCGGHTPPGRHRPLPKRARCRRHSP